MHQPKWNGSSPRWKTCWQKTAELIEREGYDLASYMDAQFELKAPFPMPNQLYNSPAIKRYETYRKRQIDPAEEAIRRLEIELDFLQTRLDTHFSLEEILAFPGSPLTPLFCYCVAVANRRNDLAEHFVEAAKQQLVRTPVARGIYLSLLEGHDAGS